MDVDDQINTTVIEARRDARVVCWEIAEMCNYAGLPHLTADLLRRGVRIQEARAYLAKCRAVQDTRKAPEPTIDEQLEAACNARFVRQRGGQ